MYIYQPHIDRKVFSVGFYDPNGEYVFESFWTFRSEAAARVSYLNGGVFFGSDSELQEIAEGKTKVPIPLGYEIKNS